MTDEEKLIEALNNIDEEELFDLCKEISEKHLSKSDDLYEFFHREKKYFDSGGDSSDRGR